MATIPNYQRQVIPGSVGVQPRASGGDAVSAGFQQLGAAGQRLSGAMAEVERRKQDEDARAWTSSALAESHIKWAKDLSDREANAPEGAPQFATNFLKDFDQYKAESLKNAPNDQAKKFFGERLDALRTSLFGQAVSFEARKNAEWKVNQGKIASDGIADMATVDPDAAKTMLAEQEAIWGGYENKQLGSALVLGAREKAARYAINGMIARDPAATLASLDKRLKDKESGGFWVDMLDGQQLVALRNQASTEVQRIVAEGKYDIVSRTKDVQSMVMAGVAPPPNVAPTVEQYTTIFGASGPARWQEEVGNYLDIGSGIQQMRTASFAERAQLVEGQRPAPGAGFAGGMQKYEATLRAAQLVDKQIASDPAAYAMATSPRVQEAQRQLDAMMAEIAAPGTMFGSPTSRQAAISLAVQRLASTTIAEQERLGVSLIRDDAAGNKPRGPKLLTNAQANAISDQFSQGGADAAALIQGLEQHWGKYWPNVYSQLAADNKLPAAALVIPNMPNDASRSRMAAVSVMKDEDLKKLMQPGDAKDVKDAILSSFDEAQRTFTAQGASGNSTFATIIEQAEKLALYYKTQGKSAKESARQAYNETLGHAYQWGDTYRVPRQYDIAQVRFGADAAVEALVKSAGATVFAGQAPQKLTEDALRFRSMWITSGDETGLELRLRGADGGVYAVQGPDGLPVTRSWADLMTRAKTAKAVDDSGDGTSEWMRRRQQELNPRR